MKMWLEVRSCRVKMETERPRALPPGTACSPLPVGLCVCPGHWSCCLGQAPEAFSNLPSSPPPAHPSHHQSNPWTLSPRQTGPGVHLHPPTCSEPFNLLEQSKTPTCPLPTPASSLLTQPPPSQQ